MEGEMLVGRWRLALLAVCSALAVVVTGVEAPAAGAEGYKFERAFGPDGTNATGFSSASSVAVDQVDDVVYVLDRTAEALFKFDLEGNPISFGGSSPNVSGNELSGLSLSNPTGSRQVAVDSISHTIYLPGKDSESGQLGGSVLQAFQANGEPAVFTAGPGAGTNEIPGFASLQGIAVDAEGNIFTSESGPATLGGYNAPGFAAFRPSGAILISNPGVSVLGSGNMGVSASGVLYVLKNGAFAARYVPSEVPISPTTTYEEDEVVDPNRTSAVAVEPGLSRLLVAEDFEEDGIRTARVAIFDEEGSPEGTFGGPGEEGELSGPTGIAAGPNGASVFVSQNPVGGGLSQVMVFEEDICICPPAIESEAGTAITGDSATLRAKINPNNRDTTYWWEYGLGDCDVTACTKIPINGASAGNGRKGSIVTQLVTGLNAQTVYHYRVVAENEKGLTNGANKTFTTQGLGLAFGLSDSRAWEMVSPPNKYAGTLFTSGETAIQAAVSGERLVYASLGSIVKEPVSSRLPEPATVLAKRNGNGEWVSNDLTPPHSEATRFRADTEFKLFTSDLLRAEMEPTDATPLSPETTEQTPYLWEDGKPPLFTPLLTSANVPPETKFGPGPGLLTNPVRIEGATSDLKSLVFRSDQVPLVEGADLRSIYVWHDGGLQAVSELPESEGGGVVWGMLGSGLGSVRHAISSDGSRVFWTQTDLYNTSGIGLTTLYIRDVDAEKSIRLDVVQPGGSGAGDAHPAFNIASADGSVIFFTDSQQLTEGASPSGRDLYRCEIGSVGGSLGCLGLTDISTPLGGSGESAEVLDQVSAASEDGTRLYLVARGVLDDSPNDEGQTAEAGEPNLYFWEEGQGNRFIGTLSEDDFPVWGSNQTLGYAHFISAAASPGGRFFSFTSEESLTGYENRNVSGDLNTEAFLYDSEDDRLTCVSCNPSGAAAVGERLPEQVEFFPPDPAGIWAKRWVAATLPQASQTQPEGRSLYRPRYVLDNGRVFFNSVDPLVPADSNGNWDVYQYQPVGVGSCALQTSTAAVVRSGNGCVGLLSSGASEGDSGFLDATPSGNDVFFLTRGRLSVLDRDSELDAYDARVNGIASVLTPTQECTGEACRSSAGVPSVAPPASETFQGAKTPLFCGKNQRKVRRNGKAVCVRKKQKHKKGKQQKKKAGKTGRAQR
jgi:hypothetical protein